jgi:hypothetical protein
MKDQHQWNSDGPYSSTRKHPQLQTQILPDAQATFSLVSKTRVAFFRKLLLQFICIGRLPLDVVESEEFRAPIRELNPGIYDYMWRSGNTTKLMLLAEFDRGKELLKLEFKAALSKIHISFDLWTSPNKLAMLGVVAHYLSPDLTAKSPLIALRKLSGNHNGENQAKILLRTGQENTILQRTLGQG